MRIRALLTTTMVSAVLGLSLPLAASAQEFGPTLQRIKDRGTITIGHRETSVPFSYIGNDEQPVGYSIDLCLRAVDAIEEKIGVDELDVKWVAVTPQTRLALIANGTIDLECGSTTNNLTRQEQVDYAYVSYITGTAYQEGQRHQQGRGSLRPCHRAGPGDHE